MYVNNVCCGIGFIFVLRKICCERSVAYYLLFSLTQIGGVELFDVRKVKWLQESPKMESCIHRQGYEDANKMVCFNNTAITNVLLVVSRKMGVFFKTFLIMTIVSGQIFTGYESGKLVAYR